MPAKPPIPILRSFDEATAKAFYIGFLGFTVDWEHRFAPDLPLYFQVSMQCCILHISEHFGDASPGSHVRIAIDDVVGYCTLLNEKKYRNARPGFENMPWGTTDMTIGDPFGNRLTFYTEAKK